MELNAVIRAVIADSRFKCLTICSSKGELNPGRQSNALLPELTRLR